jgi:hypothetical protein
VVVTLRALAESLDGEAGDDTELWGPFIRYWTLNESESDGCLDWRADIVMWTSAGDEVLVCFADFLTLKSDNRDGGEMLYILDSISESAASFSPFFDGSWLDPDIEETLGAGHVEYIVIVTYVFVESPLRGACLGAWAVSELAHRMLPSHTGLLLMPGALSTVAADRKPVSVFERKRDARMSQYWCSAGLSEVNGHPGFLAASPAFTHLPEAREAFTGIRDLRFSLTVAELRSGEIDPWSLDID